MRPEALLQSACELSYGIARTGIESDPPVEAPAAMRGFLRTGRLTDRALTVARSAIDEDPAFRRRVAEQADQDEVGRAGYLWLHRPIGWAAEFEELVMEHAGKNGDSPSNTKASAAGGDENGSAGNGTSVESVLAVHAHSEGEPVYPGASADYQDPDSPNEANAIESELSSLRGLVDRLASERKAVATSAEGVEQQVHSSGHQPSVFESDMYTLQSELEATRAELERAGQQRDSAIQQHSAALTRQLDLEKQLDAARERHAEIERGHEEADSELVTVTELLARSEASVEPLRLECGELGFQLESLKVANAEFVEQVDDITTERNAENRAAELRIHELESDVTDLERDRQTLSVSVEEANTKLQDVSNRLDFAITQSEESSSLVEMLTEEKIDVASRLADTESILETTRTQLNNVKADAEALAADLSNVKAHRDGLSTQVEELHASLGDALDNLARVRANSDDDRAALKGLRAERDQLKVRVSGLTEGAAELEIKFQAVTAERDLLVRQTEESSIERADIDRKMRQIDDENVLLAADKTRHDQAMSELASVRDDLNTELGMLKADLAEAQAHRDGLAQQVDQLTVENAAIQDQLVESDRLRVETSESQGHALSELAQRLSVVEKERSRLEGELSTALENVEQTAVLVTAAQADADAVAARDQTQDAPGDEVNAASLVPKSDDGNADGRPVAVDGQAVAGVPAADGPDTGLVPDEADEAAAITGGSIADIVPSDLASDKQDESRTTNRHSWSLGPLLRGAGRGRKLDVSTSDSDQAELPSPLGTSEGAQDDEFESIAAAVAEATQGIADDDTVFPAAAIDEDAEFEAVAAGLAEALGNTPEPPSAEPSSVDDELDEISNLISQTVSDMNMNEEPALTGTSEASDATKPWSKAPPSANDEADSRGPEGKPPSIFSGGSVSDVVAPDIFATASLAGGSPNGAVPPSVLSAAGAGATAVTRRRITIPDDLLDDEVEMARHIVSSPDVVLLVDGDSVAKMGWPSLPVAQQRDALVSYLADLSASTGVAPDIVFDGRKGEEESLPASRAVRIRLSTPPTEPAAALDELVDAYPEQWPIAIVTDDDELAASAGERGASILSNGQLLDLFIAP